MATCKDCFHVAVCCNLNHKTVADGCPDFKDPSRIIEMPCKVGDPVWFVGTSNANRLKMGVIEATVEKLVLKQGGIYMKLSCNAMYETSCRSIGKTVFFNKEEAEAALAKMDGAKDG